MSSWEPGYFIFLPFSFHLPRSQNLHCIFPLYNFCLLFTVEKQENKANGKPATPCSLQFRKPYIWKCVHFLEKELYKDLNFFYEK